MNAANTGAAESPPNPAPGTRLRQFPYQTAVASCGVPPMNQASARSSVVPVLPKIS